jgi:hypothetical protein
MFIPTDSLFIIQKWIKKFWIQPRPGLFPSEKPPPVIRIHDPLLTEHCATSHSMKHCSRRTVPPFQKIETFSACRNQNWVSATSDHRAYDVIIQQLIPNTMPSIVFYLDALCICEFVYFLVWSLLWLWVGCHLTVVVNNVLRYYNWCSGCLVWW